MSSVLLCVSNMIGNVYLVECVSDPILFRNDISISFPFTGTFDTHESHVFRPKFPRVFVCITQSEVNLTWI